MRRFLQRVGGSLILLAAGCPSSVPALCDNGACESNDGGSDALDGGGDVVQPPAGCDPSADPKDAPKCVVSEFGVFVDGANGADGNAGTKESPVKSISAALGKLGGKTRIYVCEGTYDEHVKLTRAVSLYAGFACGAWSYSGTKPGSRRRARVTRSRSRARRRPWWSPISTSSRATRPPTASRAWRRW